MLFGSSKNRRTRWFSRSQEVGTGKRQQLLILFTKLRRIFRFCIFSGWGIVFSTRFWLISHTIMAARLSRFHLKPCASHAGVLFVLINLLTWCYNYSNCSWGERNGNCDEELVSVMFSGKEAQQAMMKIASSPYRTKQTATKMNSGDEGCVLLPELLSDSFGNIHFISQRRCSKCRHTAAILISAVSWLI